MATAADIATEPKTLARQWAKPGTKGLTHRIGGLEKQDITGNISYDPANHQHMVDTRAQKVANIAAAVEPATTLGQDHGDVLVLGWGSTRGAITLITSSSVSSLRTTNISTAMTPTYSAASAIRRVASTAAAAVAALTAAGAVVVARM